ncbi:MAG: L,D-transpeptidase [Gaiellales bacterium]|nr:MAG: L,D-transpeptidase [Gaiellales bacterium]
MLIAAIAAAFAILGLLVFGAVFPPSVSISPTDGSIDISSDDLLKISASSYRGEILGVTVRQTTLDPMGASIEERDIEGSLVNGVFIPASGDSLFEPDSLYDVTVEAKLKNLSLTGIESKTVTETATLRTVITPVPLFTEEAQIVEIGKPIVVEFNTPIEKMSYDIQPAVTSTMTIDEENPSRAVISFEGYQQEQQFELTVTSATAKNGAALPQPLTQKIATTTPLKVTFVPGDGESAVSPSEHPSLTFTEAIRNPELAESMLTVEPATLGTWEWAEADRVEFKPLEPWQQGQQVTIRLKGGPDALRGSTGSFLREDVNSTFTVKPSKMIDVNLSTQTVMLYDNDTLVRTMICSSGSQATPSLTGTYSVYAKAEKLDMRGEGYFAPDVPWVLMFNGDYTIHGNYWATSFGTPSSHGCVGLPLNEAEYLYNWTPIGTIVSIHY